MPPRGRAERARLAGRAQQAEVARGERVRLPTPTHRDVMRGPRSDPRQIAQARDEILQAGRRLERQLARRDRGCQRADRARLRARRPDLPQVRVGERLGTREAMREPEVLESLDRLAERLHHARGERRRGLHGNLLAEDRADGDLERVPRPGNARAGARAHERRERRVVPEVCADGQRIGAEVEDPARALHDPAELRRGRKIRRQHDVVRPAGAQLDHPRRAVHLDGATVCVALHRLDAARRARARPTERRGHVERWAEREPERERVRRGAGTAAATRAHPPQLGRRAIERPADLVVELADAREARGERHLGRRKVRLVEQAPREVRAPRARDRGR